MICGPGNWLCPICHPWRFWITVALFAVLCVAAIGSMVVVIVMTWSDQ